MNRNDLILAAAALLAAAAVAACTHSTGSASPCLNRDDVGLVVRDASSSPTFDWDRACPAWTLTVTYDSSGATLTAWSISGADAANALQPPVAYGAIPSGAYALVGALPLVSPRTYDVRVYGLAHGLPFASDGAAAFADHATFTR